MEFYCISFIIDIKNKKLYFLRLKNNARVFPRCFSIWILSFKKYKMSNSYEKREQFTISFLKENILKSLL